MGRGRRPCDPRRHEPRSGRSKLHIISLYDMTAVPDHTLEFLLAFDGRIHHLERGYWIKFEIKRVRTTARRPYGISYSFTLHAPDGKRLIGFDNAHRVAAAGSRFGRRWRASDHWHPPREIGGGLMRSRMPIPCCRISFGRFVGCSQSVEFPRWLSELKKRGNSR
jgi:hypothetical protein